MKRMLVLALAAITALALVVAAGVSAAPGNPNAKGLAKGIKVSRGATTLDSQAFWQRLVDEGVTVEVLAPSKDDVETSPSPANFDPAFPITNGRLALDRDQVTKAVTDATGKINHTGGLSLTEGTNNITLRNFRINLTDDADYVSAQVSINGGEVSRARVLELDLTGASFTSTVEKRRRFRITDVDVTLSPTTSAMSFDQLFATAPATPFQTNTLVGTLAVDTRIVGRRF